MYQDVARADGVLQALADILRRMVDQSDATVVPLKDEVQLVGASLEIMGARFADDLRIETALEKGVEDWPVPPLLLQPLVENAIQHGYAEGRKPFQVSLSARRANGRLRIEIADNGPGLSEAAGRAARTGVGLSNTRERLVTQYGADHVFVLTNPPEGGLRITIEIPWTESER